MKLKNGIYIYTENGALISLSDAKEDKTAIGVVLITDHARIFIDKHEPEYMKWERAMNYAEKQKLNGNPMRLPDPHEGLEIGFNRAEISKAMDLIDGNVFGINWYWTNRKYNSSNTYSYYSHNGMINAHSMCSIYAVRPVSTFNR